MSDDVGKGACSDDLEAEADSVLRAVARAPSVEPGPVGGEVIDGTFRIESKLGAGGMGVVYLARDLRLQRQVALKLHSRADGAQRTKQEARVLARLVHPNVVTIHDVGIWRERTYLAMEYLDGGSLRTWLGARPRTWREILSLFLQAARGLEAAHRAGVIHRDFKPDNVLLGSDGRVRVADFGLARPLYGASPQRRSDEPPGVELAPASDASDDVPLTAAGTRIGTPGCMAPEAERGDALDARADQYSFCATLRAALVGCKAPFWLGAILARGLQTDPDRRHPSMGALIAALERRLRLRRWRFVPVMVVATAGSVVLAWWMTAPGGVACPAPDLPVLHVDAAASPGGNGSTACPFRTLTDALAVNVGRRVVRVAAGRYDAEHGEKLPLIIRQATEIHGAGAGVTVIAGLGYFDPQHDGITASRFLQRATLVVGDDQADIVLSEISVDSGQREITDRSIGILCTRGNLSTFDGPIPPPNTRLDNIAIGSGYETGLLVTGGTSPRLTGCNLSVILGFFHDASSGIWQVGCGVHDGTAPTALTVENSSFHAIRAKPMTGEQLHDASAGIGLVAWDCARELRVVDSLFADSDHGIEIVRHNILQSGAAHEPRDPPAVIERNELAALSLSGIGLEYAVKVNLLGNMFWGMPSALVIYSSPLQPPSVRARDNRFWGNRIAIDVRGRDRLPHGTMLDFGRTDDPGRNRFNCNAVAAQPQHATVAIQVDATPEISLGLAGNHWDHVPPRVRSGFPASERAEVVFTAGSAGLDLGGSVPTGDACSKP